MKIFFDVNKLAELVSSSKDTEAQQYINKFFFKIGIYVYVFNGHTHTFDQYSVLDAMKLIPNDIKRYNKRAIEFDAINYLRSTKFMSLEYNTIIDFQQDSHTFEKDSIRYINMAKPLILEKNTVVDKDIYQPKLQLLYDHIRLVWADNDDDVYEYILNFIACSVTGKRKLRKALYLPCATERAGRGTVLNFINNVIGERMYKSNSTEEILKYTKNFEGTSLINFDELPTDSSNYRSIGDSMKALITEPTFVCRNMFCKGYSQKYPFNIIITSNNNAINLTQSNNNRYLVCNVNTSKVGDKSYFTTLNNLLKIKEVQILFYQDMESRYNTTCSKWNEDDMPETSTKREKLIESLPLFLKWLKDNYVLKGRDINVPTTDFYKEYYHQTHDKTSKQKIGSYLSTIGINSVKVRVGADTKRFFRKDHTEMLKIFQEKHWIDNDLEYVDNDEEDCESDQLDIIVPNPKKFVKIECYDIMKQKIKELEEQLAVLTATKEQSTDSETEIENDIVIETKKKKKKKIKKNLNASKTDAISSEKTKTKVELETTSKGISITFEDMEIFF